MNEGLIVIHELVSVAAPGLGVAAYRDTGWVQTERDDTISSC